MPAIPYGRQYITQSDIEAVVNVLQSDYLTTGPAVGAFEKAFAEYLGVRFAVAVSSGTAALHLCALALDVQPGDRVLTTTNTFAASANCVLYAGGEIDLVDIEPDTFLIDIEEVRRKLEAASPGTYKGIIPVDFAGYPVDMEAFRALADEHDCWLIEDSCHAPGGYFMDQQGEKQYCGSGNFADLAIFSFHPVKHIASGEGGMITTNNEALYQKLLYLRTHGITRDRSLLAEDHGGWYYEMIDLGFNYRLSDIHAALGLSQLQRAEEGLARRKELARQYDQALTGLPLRTPRPHEGHAYHLYVIQTPRRKELYNYLRQHQIYVQIHYIPVHYQPYYQQKGWKKGDFPRAEAYYEGCISLPMYPSMTDEQQVFVVEKIKDFFK